MWRDEACLRDIVDCCERIIAKTKDRTLEQFLETEDLHDIVVRQFSVIGEAARQLSDEARERIHDVPWHEIVAMRIKLIHEYRDIDLTEVWKTIQVDITHLMTTVKRDLGLP